MKLLAQLDELREEAAQLRKARLRAELALHKVSHENDRLRARLRMMEKALAEVTNDELRVTNGEGGRPLTLTDRGDEGDGYGVGYDSD